MEITLNDRLIDKIPKTSEINIITKHTPVIKSMIELSAYARKVLKDFIDKKELNERVYINDTMDLQIYTDLGIENSEEPVSLQSEKTFKLTYRKHFEIFSFLLSAYDSYMYLVYKNEKYYITIDGLKEIQRITKYKIPEQIEFRDAYEVKQWLESLIS